MAIRERTYTADELWALSHQSGYADMRLELSEGELIIMSPAGGKHGGVALNLGILIGTFVRQHKLGYTTAAETGYILLRNADGRDVVRAPDVGFVAMDRLPDGLPDGYIPLAPDLAVEVVSPNDDASDIHKKVLEYLRYGTQLVWVVYPLTQSVVIHTAEKAITIGVDSTLDGGEVLPGLTLPVTEIFR